MTVASYAPLPCSPLSADLHPDLDADHPWDVAAALVARQWPGLVAPIRVFPWPAAGGSHKAARRKATREIAALRAWSASGHAVGVRTGAGLACVVGTGSDIADAERRLGPLPGSVRFTSRTGKLRVLLSAPPDLQTCQDLAPGVALLCEIGGGVRLGPWLQSPDATGFDPLPLAWARQARALALPSVPNCRLFH